MDPPACGLSLQIPAFCLLYAQQHFLARLLVAGSIIKESRSEVKNGYREASSCLHINTIKCMFATRTKLSNDIVSGNWSVKLFFNCDLNVFVNLAL